MIVNALAPALNTMPLISIPFKMETPVVLETSNVAVSAGELGTVAGVQLAAVFHLPLPGFRFHVALPAKAVLAAAEMRSNSAVTTIRAAYEFALQ